jgi:hypothetical protein
MEAIAGAARGPLVVMFVFLAIAAPVMAFSGLPVWMGYLVGTTITLICVALGFRRIFSNVD